MPTRPMNFARYCLIQWISKLPGSFEIQSKTVQMYLVSVVFFLIKDLETYEMTMNFESNFYVGPVNIFPNFWQWYLPPWRSWYAAEVPFSHLSPWRHLTSCHLKELHLLKTHRLHLSWSRQQFVSADDSAAGSRQQKNSYRRLVDPWWLHSV